MKNKPIPTIVLAVILAFFAIHLTSCSKGDGIPVAETKVEKPAPDPAAEWKERAEEESEQRQEAETREDKAVAKQEKTQGLAIGLGILSIVGFVVGASIGSRGRQHATG